MPLTVQCSFVSGKDVGLVFTVAYTGPRFDGVASGLEYFPSMLLGLRGGSIVCMAGKTPLSCSHCHAPALTVQCRLIASKLSVWMLVTITAFYRFKSTCSPLPCLLRDIGVVDGSLQACGYMSGMLF